MKIISTIKKITTKYPFLRNKYFLVSITFCIWMLFIDSDNLIVQIKRTKEKQNLEASKEFFNQNIRFCELQLYLLKNDINFLEKLGREKYRLKKDNEDLFIIDTTSSTIKKK